MHKNFSTPRCVPTCPRPPFIRLAIFFFFTFTPAVAKKAPFPSLPSSSVVFITRAKSLASSSLLFQEEEGLSASFLSLLAMHEGWAQKNGTRHIRREKEAHDSDSRKKKENAPMPGA